MSEQEIERLEEHPNMYAVDYCLEYIICVHENCPYQSVSVEEWRADPHSEKIKQAIQKVAKETTKKVAVHKVEDVFRPTGPTAIFLALLRAAGLGKEEEK